MHAKPRGGAIATKGKDTLANQKPVGMRKGHIGGNGMQECRLCMQNKVELLLSILLALAEYKANKMQKICQF